MRVLLVDDEAELVEALAERLSLRGIDADWAVTSKDALGKLDTQEYDVALLDVKMPKLSGIELKREMEKRAPGMKFIFLTGHGSEADFRAGTAEAGVDYYLVKPVGIDELLKKMKEIVGEGGDRHG
ncbi:MAG: response regulator [Deltaproteobacteria bacterium]|nr:response regulator [Deltaproteobacteria bacterium]